MLIKLGKALSLLFVVALICWAGRVSSSASQSTATTQRTTTRENNTWKWNHSEDGIKLEVAIHGEVEFEDDYSDVRGIKTDDGSIRIMDERGGVTRRFEAKVTSDGIKRSYSVNGQATPISDESRAWLKKVLMDTVRQGGYDAKPRVRKILAQSGPNGVLTEISTIKSDYVKRIYFDELLAQGNLDAEQSRQALRQASREIRSDYEKAQLLIKMSASYVRDDQSREIYIEGVNSISSDYEKGRALSALLKQGNLSHENLLFAIKSAHSLTSNYEKSQLLIKIASAFPFDESARVAYIEGVSSMTSDYEKGRVLSALLKKDDLRKENLLFAVKSASTISSDYEKAQLLIKIAAASSADESVRNALVDSARSIKSEYERGRVLSAVFK
ncbi:MAG: hypothetical protein WBV94_08770 [Blastocatellia bacterium]